MKRIISIIGLAFIISLVLVSLDNQDKQVIKFFPLDKSIDFTEYKTELSLLTSTAEDSFKVGWTIQSQLDKPVYLRQDISLLFIDGRLKGILNQWKESVDDLAQQTIFNGEGSSHFEAISFHHGEVHYPDDLMKSIQAMSYDELYVVDSPHSQLDSFKEPVSESQMEWKKTLDHAKYQQLTYYWNRLMDHYHLSNDDYLEIPLTQLRFYEKEPLPTLTLEQTQVVLGQLWEGLYRHYILGINSEKTNDGNPLNTYMPLILVDNQGKHLYVLYEDTKGKKHQLIQQIPDFN